MLILKLIKKVKNQVEYEYFVEGVGDPGRIVAVDGEILEIELSKDDAVDTYACMAMGKIRKFFESGEFPEKCSVAFY
ncbi:MAG: hypothetical protein RR626_00365 [Anaerovoracaceae bacterium]